MTDAEPTWLALDAAADRCGVPTRRLAQWVRDGQVVARRAPDGALQIPAEFLAAAAPVKGLPGVITLLRDARYADAEIVEWLFRPDETLPGTPIGALAADRGTEVKRRAQVAGY